MTIRTCSFLLALVLLAGLLLGPLSRQLAAQERAVTQERAAPPELQMAIDKYIAAYNEGAIDRVMAFWTENADFVDIRGRFHEGRDLIAALFRRGFANNPGRKLTMTSSARKILADNVAMDDGILELTGTDGEKDRGRYSVVWTKANDGQWRIRSARDIPLEEEEEPVTAAQPQGPPLEQLAWLVGRWEAKSDRHQISLDCGWTLDKSFLVQTFDIKSADDTFRVVTYIAHDPSDGQFRSWFFDSRGGFGGGPWVQRDRQWKSAISAVLPDGQLGSSFFTWEPVDQNTVIWRAVEREIGGEALPDAEQKYIRVAGAAKAPSR